MDLYSPYFIIKRLQLEVFKKYSGYLSGRILDVGCGNMPYKKYLTDISEYIGMDETKAVKPDILGSVQAIPFPDKYFDSVLCTEVLEHVSGAQDALREIKRVLKSGGYLYLTVPQAWPLHYEPNDYFRFTKYGIKHLLEEQGLKVIAIERIGGIFSLIGQTLLSVSWGFVVSFFRPICTLRWAERIASIICLPFSLFFYLFGKIVDKIEKQCAICWMVLVVK